MTRAEPRARRARRGRILRRLLIAAVLAGAAVASATHWDVEVYNAVRPAAGVRIDPVSVTTADLALVGEIYRPDATSATRLPGVVLLHGTSPAGRSLLLYRLLATQLARRGAVTLLYDQRGYGESPDPPLRPEGDYALDFVDDAVRAVELLAAQPDVDPARVRLTGHSFGGSVAIGVAHVPGIEQRLELLFVISPGRGWPYTGDRRFEFRRRRLSGDMDLDPPIGLEAMRRMYAPLEVETLVDAPPRLPVVLVNGSREELLKPLRPVGEAMTSPHAVVVVDGTGHYFHTDYRFNRLGWDLRLYQQEVLDELARVILETRVEVHPPSRRVSSTTDSLPPPQSTASPSSSEPSGPTSRRSPLRGSRQVAS